MKYLIIPDVHEELAKLGQAMKHVTKADKVIFLGDWFDSFSKKLAIETAAWLKDALGNPNYIFLMGNHDNHYRWEQPNMRCSGFQQWKVFSINSVLSIPDWSEIKLFHFDNGYLFSHAGLHPYYWNKYCDNNINGLYKAEVEAIGCADTGADHWMFNVGASRGGRNSYGGINWLDWNLEFEPIPGMKQIVGHTYKSGGVRQNGDNWCLDNGLHQVMLLDTETDEMEVIAL